MTITLGATHPKTLVLGHCWYVGWVESGSSESHLLCGTTTRWSCQQVKRLMEKFSWGLRQQCDMEQILFSC